MNTNYSPPYKLGADFSGIVAAVGTDVETLKVGDEVWGCLPFEDSGKVFSAPFFYFENWKIVV